MEEEVISLITMVEVVILLHSLLITMEEVEVDFILLTMEEEVIFLITML
jgi:hypothetical protein